MSDSIMVQLLSQHHIICTSTGRHCALHLSFFFYCSHQNESQIHDTCTYQIYKDSPKNSAAASCNLKNTMPSGHSFPWSHISGRILSAQACNREQPYNSQWPWHAQRGVWPRGGLGGAHGLLCLLPHPLCGPPCCIPWWTSSLWIRCLWQQCGMSWGLRWRICGGQDPSMPVLQSAPENMKLLYFFKKKKNHFQCCIKWLSNRGY